MSKPKAKLVERRNMNGERYLVFDSEMDGIVNDWEDWGFKPNLAHFLAWCIKNRKEIEARFASSGEAEIH